MINVAEVTDFKRAVGAVERAACQRLRAAAAAVPANRHIVEIGAHLGRTTGFLALGASEGNSAPVTTIDPWETRPLDSWPDDYPDAHVIADYSAPDTHKRFLEHLARARIANVDVRKAFAVDVAADWKHPVGLLWHDGPHSYDEVRADLEAWEPHVSRGGVVMLHDAGNPEFGVYDAAVEVLSGSRWGKPELHRWRKHPEKRGTLTVRRKG